MSPLASNNSNSSRGRPERSCCVGVKVKRQRPKESDRPVGCLVSETSSLGLVISTSDVACMSRGTFLLMHCIQLNGCVGAAV